MKYIMIILFILNNHNTFSQIKTLNINKSTIDTIKVYDGSVNFLGKDVKKYINEYLYVKPLIPDLRKYGYHGFLHDFKRIGFKKNTFKCCDGVGSKYDELAGKYFKVIDIVEKKDENTLKSYNLDLSEKKIYLKLEERENKDTLYFEYNENYETSFPFIAVKYFEKQKNEYVGKEYFFRKNYIEGKTDIETGKTINIDNNVFWKCIDLIIDENHYDFKYIFESLKGEKISIDQTFLEEDFSGIFLKSEVEELKKIFGNDNFKLIFEGKVKIGMTKEMCKKSWGIPNSVNKTNLKGTLTEQWVYGSKRYLYFENSILTAFQN